MVSTSSKHTVYRLHFGVPVAVHQTLPSPSLPLSLSASVPPAVNLRLRSDHLIKLSISHALAQSAKLSVYEERVIQIVESTKDLPEALAATGEVRCDLCWQHVCPAYVW